MKKLSITFIALFALSLLCSRASAQATTAMDFHRADCNGTMRHLYDDLDSGNIVILEFFMDSCNFCVDAAHALEGMGHKLQSNHGVTVVGYAFPFTDVYPKAQVANWVNVNRLRSIPMDSGEVMVNYYGGFGMPTVVILGGTDHKVISSILAFLPYDTTAAYNATVAYINNASGIEPVAMDANSLRISSIPASSYSSIEMKLLQTTMLDISIVDMEGRTVSQIVSEKVSAGAFTRRMDLSQLPAGNYIVRISADAQVISRTITVAK